MHSFCSYFISVLKDIQRVLIFESVWCLSLMKFSFSILNFFSVMR